MSMINVIIQVLIRSEETIMYTAEDVANRITALCTEHHISLYELAKRSKVPSSTVKNIVNGSSKNPGIVTIKKLCDGLGITLAEFFE